MVDLYLQNGIRLSLKREKDENGRLLVLQNPFVLGLLEEGADFIPIGTGSYTTIPAPEHLRGAGKLPTD